ncbi:MAG: hypothetical protein IPP94_09915 [Ignavibacteria bacterium]|nr:hypothetical protein [Ignavibacteria bacterium]
MRILFSVLLSTLFVTSAMAQHADPQAPVRYGFVKGREYVYKIVSRHLDKTEKPDYYGDNFLHTLCVGVCVQDVDSAGNVLMIVSTLDERYEPIGDLDAASIDGQSMGRRPMSEPKFGVSISCTGEFLSGALLEELAETRKFREKLEKNPEAGSMSPDSVLLKWYTWAIFPVLPGPKRLNTGPGDGPAPMTRWNWTGDYGCKLSSTLRDSTSYDAITGKPQRYSILETMQPSENTRVQGKFKTQFERYSMRGVFRASDGVVTEWKSVIQTRLGYGDTPKRDQNRYLSENIVTLEEEKPCVH